MSIFEHLLVNLGPNDKPKNAQSWPQVFWALTPPIVKMGLIMLQHKKFTNPSRPISVHGILLICISPLTWTQKMVDINYNINIIVFNYMMI
jgi:hypothetical protein